MTKAPAELNTEIEIKNTDIKKEKDNAKER